MIEIFRKKNGLSIRELYFAPKLVESTSIRDIDFYIQCGSPIPGGSPFWSLSADLHQDEDTLFNGLSRTFRSHVRRAADKDNLAVEVNFTPTPEDIKSFSVFFDEFAKQRGIPAANIPKLEIFREAGHLSIVLVKEPNGNAPLAMHCYVSDGYRARLYHSVTSPRNGIDNSLLARANKLLHWQTILAMKRAGLSIYDFGGISRTEELKGIDNFKLQFGGFETEEYNATLGVSCRGRLALQLADILEFATKKLSQLRKINS